MIEGLKQEFIENIRTQKPRIVMPLYETEREVLECFMESVRIEEEISEDYLILYNFATDCKYAEEIQPQLLQYLLPFYFKCVREYVLEENPIARDVCWEFNTALFGNKKSIINAVGIKNYQDIMSCYIELVLESMAVNRNEIFYWVPFFNTMIALTEDNIKQIFSKVLQSTSEIKYAFFRTLPYYCLKKEITCWQTVMKNIFGVMPCGTLKVARIRWSFVGVAQQLTFMNRK